MARRYVDVQTNCLVCGWDFPLAIYLARCEECLGCIDGDHCWTTEPAYCPECDA